MKKKLLAGIMCAVLLAGCGAYPVNTVNDGADVSDKADISEETESAQATDAETGDAMVEYPNLNYALGIQNGIYAWVKTEDENYYVLCAVDENGEPIESESEGFGGFGGGMGGMRQGGGGMPQGGDGQLPEGFTPGEGDFDRQGGMSGEGGNGGFGGDMGGDPLAMEGNELSASFTANFQGVYTESNVTNTEYQTMLVFVPAAYLDIAEDGSISFTDTQVGDYTAATAPIVFQNNNGGWRSGSPKAPEYMETLSEGMIYVSCGSRSRDASSDDGTPTGKTPTQVVDLKAGVIALRANADVIPGNKDRIISVGASGGGQMSSALGATGNMEEYYPLMYEAGVIGVSYDETTGDYSSVYDDSVYAAMCYCPIADIENADLAYAWFRYDSTTDEKGNLTQTAGSYDFTEFKLALQEDEAYSFAEYINSLNLKDENGNELGFDVTDEDGRIDLRAGSFYEKTLENMSDALNAYLAALDDPEGYFTDYGDTSAWLTDNGDGTYSVTDLAAFINGTGLTRNKDIPGFDTFDLSAENDAFGTTSESAVHYSASVAKVLRDNYEKYRTLDGFDSSEVDAYIENALTGDEAQAISDQAYLVNATHIMLDVAAGTQDADIAKYWRTRNGTADQHTSFSVAYDITLAARMAGADADYALVWAMGHGSNEGNTTGTFVDWIKSIV